MKTLRKYSKTISSGLILTFLFELLSPVVAMANTTNENQVEFSGAGGGGGEMVNMYTGSLNYSIPLMTVPGPNIGYNITLNYNSDEAKMMNDASMVGFGWNLNIGSISRQVQGVPDDFNGDQVHYRNHVKPYKSWDLGLGELTSTETWGLPFDLSKPKVSKEVIFSYTGHIYWDNYSGLGLRVGANASKDLTKTDAAGKKEGASKSISGGLEWDTKKGIGYNLSGSYSIISAHASGSMTTGLQSIGAGYSGKGTASLGISFTSLIPATQTEMKTDVYTGSLKLGLPSKFNSLLGGGASLDHLQSPNALLDFLGVHKLAQFKNKGLLGSFKMDFVNSSVRQQEFDKASNGYLYRFDPDNHHHVPKENVKDFIRYSFPYQTGTTFLPISQIGNDIFVQSDQGSGGAFTARSNSFETWSTQTVQSETNTLHIGGEFGMGTNILPPLLPSTDFHIGVNVLVGNKGTNESGESAAFELTSHSKEQAFVKSSEIHIEKNSALENFGDDDPARYDFTTMGDFFGGKAAYTLRNSLKVNDDKTSKDISSKNRGGNAFKRQSYVQYFTTEEALRMGRSKGFGYLKMLSNNTSSAATNKRNSRNSHIAEINVFENNGLIYTYSNPVYCLKRSDAMFSLDTRTSSSIGITELERRLPNGNKTSESDPKVNFGQATDLGGGLHAGMEVLNVTETKNFATSWPVTMITSTDYVDVDGKGPSNEDLGSWVKFKYNDYYRDFKFRSPYSNVSLIDGVKGEEGDDMAFYRYGEKEVKYLKYVETKTHVAIFYYNVTNDPYEQDELREDGYPVKDELYGEADNTTGSKSMYKLSNIKLFLKRNDLDPTKYTALIPGTDLKRDLLQPMQTVYLDYDYSLVQGEPSNINGGGKLTLKKVYTIFHNNLRGLDYKYVFTYNDANPKYNRANVDRWGDFKQNIKEDGSSTNAGYPFHDAPYTEDRDNYLQNAPWCLKQVKLPTGATLDFEYEARDYAYVENRAATKMYDIVSMEDLRTENPSINLSDAANRNVGSAYNEASLFAKDHVVIELPANDFSRLSEGDRNKTFFADYLSGIENELLVMPYVFLNSNNATRREKDYDYVELMARLDLDDQAILWTKADNPFAVKEIDGKYYGIIELDKVYPQGLNPTKISPIRAAAFDHIKEKRQEVYFGRLNDDVGTQINNAIALLASTMIGEGFTGRFIHGEYASAIRYNGWSKIRLKDPNGMKKGGGYRVKAVTLDDKWNSASSTEQSYSYKQTYQYTMNDDNGKLISSGVASEPAIGREEDARHQIFYYVEKSPAFEWNKHAIMGNPMDVYNPGPSVGYRKVVVSNEYPKQVGQDALDINQIQLSVAPHTEYLFNTLNDYPVIKKFTQTSSQYLPLSLNLAVPGIFSVNAYNNAVSQGYCVINNDMAGKLKKITQLTRTDKVISSQEYEYYQNKKPAILYSYDDNFKTVPVAYTVDHLSNEGIWTLNSGLSNSLDQMKYQNDGIRIGEDYDIWLDVNENSEKMDEIGYAQFGLGFGVIASVPPAPYLSYIMPLPLPINHTSKSERQAVLNKVISRRGILKQVKTTKDQSEIRTEYLAYDQETAAPLLTKVDNEWHNTNAQDEGKIVPVKDPSIYKFTRPAYWEYTSGLSGSQNWSPFLGAYKTIDSKYPSLTISNGTITTFGVIFSDGDVVSYTVGNVNNNIGYINKDKATGVYKLYTDKYLLVTTSVSDVRVIRSGYTNLINTTVGELVSKEINLPVDGTKVIMSDFLNASAITFSDSWEKNCCASGVSSDFLTNPYINGSRNKWMPHKSFVFHNDRLYSNPSYSQGGLLNNFTHFNWQTSSGTNWVLSSEAIKYDLFGNLLEQKDALGLPSSSIFGYGKTVVTGVVANSSQKEAAVENFEDSSYPSCDGAGTIGAADGLQIGEGDKQISDDKAHTGKYSLKVAPGQTHDVEKVIIQCK